MFEDLPALSPVQFFSLTWDCPYTKIKLNQESKLPHPSDLLNEDPFAEVYMGWNEQRISLEVRVNARTEDDGVEFFFDTRDAKTKNQISKFCHHFYFSPDEKNGSLGREMTRFRGDDIHPLCDPKDLKVESEKGMNSYTLKIAIPSHCLYGYEPFQFSRLGFTYRIVRANGPSQHFAVSSEDFNFEQTPSLWASVKLIGVK